MESEQSEVQIESQPHGDEADGPDEPKKDSSVDQGHRQVRAIAASVIGAIILVHFRAQAWDLMIMQLVVLGLLFLQLFRGRTWARYVLASLTILIAVNHGYVSLTHFEQAGPIAVLLALVNAGCCAALLFSPKVKAYLRAQTESQSEKPA